MSSNDERPAVFGLQPNRAPDLEPDQPVPAPPPGEPDAAERQTDADDADQGSTTDEADAAPRLQTPTEYLVELCGLHQIVLLGDHLRTLRCNNL